MAHPRVLFKRGLSKNARGLVKGLFYCFLDSPHLRQRVYHAMHLRKCSVFTTSSRNCNHACKFRAGAATCGKSCMWNLHVKSWKRLFLYFDIFCKNHKCSKLQFEKSLWKMRLNTILTGFWNWLSYIIMQHLLICLRIVETFFITFPKSLPLSLSATPVRLFFVPSLHTSLFNVRYYIALFCNTTLKLN
jgi:hypothetical protein